MQRVAVSARIVFIAGALASALHLDGPMAAARADEKKLIECVVYNQGDTPIYVWIDDTGRMGDGKTPDKVTGPDGKEFPKGLVIPAKSNKTYGEAVGGGDAPTFHLWLVDAKSKITETKEHASKKVGPVPKLDEILKGERPKFEVVWTGSEFKGK